MARLQSVLRFRRSNTSQIKMLLKAAHNRLSCKGITQQRITNLEPSLNLAGLESPDNWLKHTDIMYWVDASMISKFDVRRQILTLGVKMTAEVIFGGQGDLYANLWLFIGH